MFSFGIALLSERVRDLLTGGEAELTGIFRDKFPELKDPICEKVEEVVSGLIEGFREQLWKDVVSHPRTLYENRKADAERHCKLAIKEQERIAEEAKQARETRISPLRAKCDAFLSKVRSLFPDCNA